MSELRNDSMKSQFAARYLSLSLSLSFFLFHFLMFRADETLLNIVERKRSEKLQAKSQRAANLFFENTEVRISANQSVVFEPCFKGRLPDEFFGAPLGNLIRFRGKRV